MKLFLPLVFALSLSCPAHAQDDPQAGEGLFSFMDRIFREFMQEAEPQLRLLERGMTELEPDLNRLLDRMRDMAQYHPPEVLPNGDILIRRRQPDEDAPETAPDPVPEPAPDPVPDGPPLEL